MIVLRDKASAKGFPMASRFPKEWLVYESIENDQHDRCVDLFERTDGTHGFEEYRRDYEDAGSWVPIQYYGYESFNSRDAAFAAAVRAVRWLAEK